MKRSVIELDLGRGYVTKVYSDTFERLKLDRFKWRPQVSARAGKVYATTHPSVYLHRLITKAQKGEVVDHINGDSLDNRDDNLRKCSVGQNRANSRKDRDNRCGYKGVTWAPTSHRWMAQITHAGVRYYLGLYQHKLRAAFAHDRAALAIHGEHAGLNFPSLRSRIRPVMPQPPRKRVRAQA